MTARCNLGFLGLCTVLAVLIASVPARAQKIEPVRDTSIVGVGAGNCGAVLKRLDERTKSCRENGGTGGFCERNARHMLTEWADGFLSAINAMRAADDQVMGDLTGKGDQEARGELLMRYCTRRDDTPFIDAVVQLYNGLPAIPQSR